MCSYLDLYLIHWPVAFPAEGNPHQNLFPKANDKEVKIDTTISLVRPTLLRSRFICSLRKSRLAGRHLEGDDQAP